MSETIPHRQCKRCQYTWVPRIEESRVCPRCRSAWWDVDRKPDPALQGIRLPKGAAIRISALVDGPQKKEMS